MLKMVDGTGIIGVDMICPLGVSTPQPPNYDKVEMEGAGILVLPNSLNAPLERLELGGKTEQVQTSGKNLANANVYEQGYLTSVNAGDKVSLTQMQKSFTTNMEVSSMQGKNVSVSVRTKEKTGKKYVFTDETDTIITGVFDTGSNNYSEFKNITIPKNAKKLFFSVTYDAQENTELQVELGTTVTTYELYTGGKPSPSQEYPQEIKNSGKWNEETRKYEVDVKVTGRNLFNGKLSKGKYITDDMNVVSDLVTMNTFDKPVEIEPNTDYVISANGVIWEGNINVYDENGKKIVQHFTGKFKTPSNAKYIRASISNARAPIDSKIQMEYGTAMNEFEQYHQPQTLTLTSDRPLTKWDRLVEQGGQIGWLYQSAIDTDIRPSRTDLFPYGFKLYKNHSNGVYTYTVTNIKKIKGYQTSYCKQFKNVDGSYNTGELYRYSDQPSMQSQYFNTDIATKEEFIKWMENNPLTMVYKTEETEFVPLPQSEQNAIRALKTYYPTTVITADGGELDPDIKATYRKEI